MATLKGKKTAAGKTKATAKKTPAAKKETTSKKLTTAEQIKNLETALANVKKEDVVNLVPEEIKADIEAEMKEAAKLENPTQPDYDAEIKEMFNNPEPSTEIKEQVEAFEEIKKEVNEKMASNPEKVEEVLTNELNKLENIRKKVESIKKNLLKDGGTSNYWNGSSNGLY